MISMVPKGSLVAVLRPVLCLPSFFISGSLS